MKKTETEKQLRKLGYNREDFNMVETNYNDPVNKDLSDKNLNHSIDNNKCIKNVIFDRAAATGSIYQNCVFMGCSMDQVDFEFCTFSKCAFKSNKKIISSFNGSNFIETTFENESFESCTFTGTLFENCKFKNVEMAVSTFEGAYFNNCTFINMDLGNVNMEFVHIKSPIMENVVLPFAQIPYMFGCLQYLSKTNNAVRISSNKSTISLNEYLEVAIPILIEYWTENRAKQPEFNFPLANVYIYKGFRPGASESVTLGLKASVENQDYRMIKFYCTLISESNYFKSKTVEEFYSLINKLAPKESIIDPKTRSFIRNIGEIRASLFPMKKETSFYIKLLTNLHFSQNTDVGIILGKLFSLSKMAETNEPNQNKIILSENSPFIIELFASGAEDNILDLLLQFIKIADIDTNLVLSDSNKQFELLSKNAIVNKKTDGLISYCNDNNIEIVFMEYQLENSKKGADIGIIPFAYNSFNNNSLNKAIHLTLDK